MPFLRLFGGFRKGVEKALQARYGFKDTPLQPLGQGKDNGAGGKSAALLHNEKRPWAIRGREKALKVKAQRKDTFS